MTRKNEEVSGSADAVKLAERCRHEALMLIRENPNQYTELAGQPSGWCVVTKKGLWGTSFHVHLEEGLLREAIRKGRNVLLTVGIVAKPDMPLTAQNHAAVVRVAESCKLTGVKLLLLTSNAKLKAAHALSR